LIETVLYSVYEWFEVVILVSFVESKPYEPGFLSSMLAEKNIESNPEFEVESV
jgi:hypothetical protein